MDDGGYYDEDGEWWLEDFGMTPRDVKKVFNTLKANEEKLLKQTLAIMSVDNLCPSEQGLEVLKEYISGEITYPQAIEKIKYFYQKIEKTSLLN